MLSVYRKLAVTLDWAIIFVELVTITSAATLTEGPVSVSSLVGENALFHCNGSGIIISWIVDELPHDDPDIVARGISDNTVSLSGTVQSTLTVPATPVNNGTTVQCRVLSLSGFAISNNATLTVLPGIGQVVNVRFTPSFSAVLWDHPATVLDSIIAGLSYRVTTMNMNTGQVIVNETTTGTSCPLPDLKLCQNYTANVIVFSYEQQGDSVEAGLRTPGDYYRFESMSQEIVSRESSAVEFLIALRVMGLGIPCPDQRLTVQTYSQSNTSDITNHPELVIMSSGDIVYSITTGIERKQHYTATISLVGNEGIAQELALVFSTFEVQDCNVSTDHTSILVECTFAINSTAPGIVVIQDDQSQYTINKTLQRLQQDSDKGSVNITGLPAGEYSVRVYDNIIISPATDTAAAAYEHSQLLHIMEPTTGTSPLNIISSTIPPAGSFASSLILSSSSVVLSSSVTPSVLEPTVHITAFVGAAVGATIISVIIVLVVVVITVFIFTRVHKKARLISVETIHWSNEEENRYQELKFNKVPVTRDVLLSMAADNCPDSTCMGNNLSTPCATPPTVNAHNMVQDKQALKQQGPVYADLQHSTNPPAPPLPAELVPVQYATVKKQTDNTVTTQPAAEDKVLHYAQVQHPATTDRPAPPPPAEQTPVQYATVKKPVTVPITPVNCTPECQDELLTPVSKSSGFFSASSTDTSETIVTSDSQPSLSDQTHTDDCNGLQPEDCRTRTVPSDHTNHPGSFVSGNSLVDVRS